MKSFYLVSALTINIIVFALSTMLWWQKSGLPYNEAGRYYDGNVVWHEQGIVLYAFLSVFSLIALLSIGYLLWKESKDNAQP